MDPRTVLYLHSSAGRYGADRQLALLAGGLDPARYRPLVVLPFPGPLAEDLRERGADVVVRPLAVLRRALATPAGAAGLVRALGADLRALPRLAPAREVALVHSNTSVILGGGLVARRLGVPHVWHLRETYDGFGALWPAWRAALVRTGTVVCISHAVRDQLRGGEGRVIRDGVALPGPPPSREDARHALGLPPDVWTVALPGRLSSWKGQDVLLRALAALPGALGLLAGTAWREDAGREEDLHALATRLGVADRIRFLGFRPDVQTVLAAADAVAVPSVRPEPLGNAALEAALAGRPVVASDHGGLAEAFTDQQTALLVPPGDPDALARALARLRDDPALAERIALAARHDVEERFAPESLLARVQDLYDELLA